jgi:hypothetical protein
LLVASTPTRTWATGNMDERRFMFEADYAPVANPRADGACHGQHCHPAGQSVAPMSRHEKGPLRAALVFGY